MKCEFKEIVFFCGNMQKMKRFYSKVLRMPQYNPEGVNPGWVEFGTEEFRVCLHDAKEPGSLEKNVET